MINQTKQSSKLSTSHLILKNVSLFLVILIIIIVLSIITIYLLWPHLSTLLAWLAVLSLFFISRRYDSWKIGIEIFYFTAFASAFIFGLFFTLTAWLASSYLIFKARPDELNGLVAHTIVLSGVMIFAKIFTNFHSLVITEHTFTAIAFFSCTFWIAADTLLAIKIAPVPVPKAIVNHSLEIMFNYFMISFFGYKIFKFLISLS